MSNFDYEAYANVVRLISASPGKIQQDLARLRREYESKREQEEQQDKERRLQLAQMKVACLEQYRDIREACEEAGVHVLPALQRPQPSQLLLDDALAAQNRLAREMDGLLDAHRRERHEEEDRRREREKAAELAREQADKDAKERERARLDALKQEELRQQLELERSRNNQMAFLRTLKRLRPLWIVLAIILLILLLNR